MSAGGANSLSRAQARHWQCRGAAHSNPQHAPLRICIRRQPPARPSFTVMRLAAFRLSGYTRLGNRSEDPECGEWSTPKPQGRHSPLDWNGSETASDAGVAETLFPLQSISRRPGSRLALLWCAPRNNGTLAGTREKMASVVASSASVPHVDSRREPGLLGVPFPGPRLRHCDDSGAIRPIVEWHGLSKPSRRESVS